MANSEINALAELAAKPASDDVIAIDDVTVAITTKKITVANYLSFYDDVTAVLTEKSYDLGGSGNVLTGSTAEFNTALQADSFFFISQNISDMATSTSAEFDTANSDGNFAYVGAANTFTGANIIDNATGLTWNNQGAGADPILFSNDGGQILDLTGSMDISGALTLGTDLAIAQGGTASSTAQAAIDLLSAVSGASNEFVLTKDTGSGNALWKVSASGADNLGDHTATEIIKSVTFGLQGENTGQTIIGTDASNAFTYTVPSGDTHIHAVTGTGTITSTTSGGFDVTGTLTASVLIDTPDIETGTVSARDGALAQTIANSTGVSTFVSGTVLVAPVLGTPASGALTNCTAYPGDSSLVTTGTIASGTWEGTTVAVNQGGTGTTTSTGSTNVVLSGSPTIVTPTIVSLTNMQHNHSDAAGGGTFASTNLSDTASIAYLDTANTYTAGTKQAFVADATTAGININNQVPSTTTGGDIWRTTDAITYRNNADSGDLIIATTTDLTTKFDTAGTGLTSSGTTVNVIGTASRITANANDIDIASDYVGQASIVTLGTIATGTWEGDVVASVFLDTDTAHLTTTQTFTGAKTFNEDITMSTASLLSCTDVETGTVSANDGALAQTIANSTGVSTFVSGTVLVAPVLGTPASGTLTSCTGLPLAGLVNAAKEETWSFAISDNTTALTTGTKFTWYAPYAITLTDIQASVLTAPTDATLIIDVHTAGVSIMTTDKLDIETGEFHTNTAATQPVITDTTLDAGAKIEFIIDQIGSTVAGAGAVVYWVGYQT